MSVSKTGCISDKLKSVRFALTYYLWRRYGVTVIWPTRFGSVVPEHLEGLM